MQPAYAVRAGARADTTQGMRFEVPEARTDGAHAVVSPQGQMDLSTIHLVTAVLDTQLSLGRRHVRLDLSAVTVSDLGCLRALVPVHERFLADRGLLVLSSVSPDLAPLLRVTDLDRTLLVTGDPDQPRAALDDDGDTAIPPASSGSRQQR